MNVREFIGLLLISLGITALFLGFVFYYLYREFLFNLFGTNYYDYPYRGYGVPSAILGLILLVVGFIFVSVRVEGNHQASLSHSPVFAQTKYCRHCGFENKPDAKYCEKCGKPFD